MLIGLSLLVFAVTLAVIINDANNWDEDHTGWILSLLVVAVVLFIGGMEVVSC